MSDGIAHKDLKLEPDAKSANDLSVDEAVNMRPGEVKGPSMMERAVEEVQAVAASVKDAIVAATHSNSGSSADADRPYKHS